MFANVSLPTSMCVTFDTPFFNHSIKIQGNCTIETTTDASKQNRQGTDFSSLSSNKSSNIATTTSDISTTLESSNIATTTSDISVTLNVATTPSIASTNDPTVGKPTSKVRAEVSQIDRGIVSFNPSKNKKTSYSKGANVTS
jgi:hypothetical protein